MKDWRKWRTSGGKRRQSSTKSRQNAQKPQDKPKPKKRYKTQIEFVVNVGRAPLEAEQILRTYGIKVMNRQFPHPEKDALTANVSIDVPATQAKFAAQLLVGEGFHILNPPSLRNVTGTRPASHWGKPRTAKDPKSLIVYTMETAVGARYYRRPPIKNTWRKSK